MTRALRFGLGAALLVWLAAAAWPVVYDDVLISLAYAWEWRDSGVLRWTTGEVVEGYSNPLWVALLSLTVSSGVDGVALAKLASLGSALGLLAWTAARAPDHVASTWFVVALATWSSLDQWATMGLETPLYALCLAVGWTEVLGGHERWGRGTVALGLAAICRPEGMFQLLLGLLARPRGPLTREDRLPALGVVAWLGYTAVRVFYFGAFWPAPVLAKLGIIGVGVAGLTQVWRELVVAAGPLVVAFALFRPTTPRAALVALPLLLQGAVLVRADGDWMAFGRLTLPGIAAATVAWVVAGEPRSGRVPWSLAVVAVALAAPFQSRQVHEGAVRVRREVAELADPVGAYQQGFDTPFHDQLAWVVEHVPDGGGVLTNDVGIVGQVPGVKIFDRVGLVDGRHARFLAYGGDDPAFAPGYFGGEVQFWRLTEYSGSDPVVPVAVTSRFLACSPAEGGRIRSVWCWTTDARPDAATIEARWRHLAERYPQQPLLQRSLARARTGG